MFPRSPFYPPLVIISFLSFAFGGYIAVQPNDIIPLRILNILTGLAMMSVVGGIGWVATQQPLRRWWAPYQQWAERQRIHFPLLLLGLGLGVLTAVRFGLRLQIGGSVRLLSAGIWMLGWMALIAAVWNPSRAIWQQRYAHRRNEIWALVLLTTLAGINRFLFLGSLPNIIDGDEGLHGTWARDVGLFEGAISTPFAAVDGIGTLYLWVMQQLFHLGGQNTFTLRLLPAIAGTLAIPVSYLCFRVFLGARTAWIAAILLAVTHSHVHFSRTAAVLYIYATLFVPLVLYLFYTGIARQSIVRMVAAACALCLHINIYVDAWVWLVLLGLICCAWILIDRQFLWDNRAMIGVFVAVLSIFIAPMILWAVSQPDNFFARLQMDGTLMSGWLSRETQLTGQSEQAILLSLLLYALSTFGHRPFLDFYFVDQPTLDPISRYVWIVGVVVLLLRVWDRRRVVINGWFWGGVVALAVMTIPPSTYHYRLLVVLPVVCAMVGYVVDLGLRGVAWVAPRLGAKIVNSLLLVPLLGGMLWLNLTTYWTFATSCQFWDRHTRSASLLGTYASTLPPSARIVLLPTADSLRYGVHQSVDFLSGGVPIVNVDAALAPNILADLQHQSGETLVVIAVPARFHEIDQLRQQYPQGQELLLQDCDQLVLRGWVIP